MSGRKKIWWPTLARQLVHRGYAVLRIDLNGHGESGGEFSDFTYTRSVQDVEAAVTFLFRQRRINRYAIGGIGHSLGGAALMLAKARGSPLKTLVLLAAVCDTAWHYRHLPQWKKIREFQRRGVRDTGDREFNEHLRLRPRFLRDAERQDTIFSASAIHQPVLIVHGDDDVWAPAREAKRLFRALHEPKKLAFLPGVDHMFNKPTHQQWMFKVVHQWLRDYLAKRVSRSVVAFIMHRGRMLILKRSRQVGYHRGKWGIVAGHLSDGTSPLAQAYEEVLEETGLRRADLRLVRTGGTVRVDDTIVGKVWLSTPVVFEAKKRHVRLNWEHTAYRWIDPQHFPFKQSYLGIEEQFRALGLL